VTWAHSLSLSTTISASAGASGGQQRSWPWSACGCQRESPIRRRHLRRQASSSRSQREQRQWQWQERSGRRRVCLCGRASWAAGGQSQPASRQERDAREERQRQRMQQRPAADRKPSRHWCTLRQHQRRQRHQQRQQRNPSRSPSPSPSPSPDPQRACRAGPCWTASSCHQQQRACGHAKRACLSGGVQKHPPQQNRKVRSIVQPKATDSTSSGRSRRDAGAESGGLRKELLG
jgi:hypothetical protein